MDPSEPQAAIDTDDLPGDPRSRIPSEERHHLCDVLRLAKPAKHRLLREISSRLIVDLQHVRLDWPGRHGIDADLQRSELLRECAGERLNGALGGRVDRL